jgi:two-component system, LuxR family, sensor kinase FixL
MTFNPEEQAARILAAIVESSDDAIIGTDPDGLILTWNRGAASLYGYTRDEVRGRSIALLIPEADLAGHAALLERTRNGEDIASRESTHLTADGRVLDVSVSISAIREVSGPMLGLCFVARDLTTEKRRESALRVSDLRWQSVVESAVDGIVVIDSRGRIEAFNPAAERLFGYSESEVVGCNVSMLMPPPYRDEHDGYLARYLREGSARIIGAGREVRGLRRDGTVFPLHLSVGEMSGEGERKFTGILHDLSARVRMEEQVREQAALARLGEMAAVIAHEVKNPLAGVRGAIQVIGARMPQGPDALVVTEILARIDALSDLMKDLLLFARPPQPKVAPVDVRSVVTATAELLNADPALRDVRVEFEGLSRLVAADAELLKIVFLNLLLNGAHAMQGRGSIRVSVSAAAGTCQIAFADSGPGIPAEIRDKMFTPFFTTKSRGTGLGLPTAKRLVEAHAGSIRIESPHAGGTTVTIQLPLPD